MVVLISNGGVDYCGVGLVEVVWKIVTVILYCHFTASVSFNDVFHGFQAGSSIGTASLEAKLLRQITATEVPLPLRPNCFSS